MTTISENASPTFVQFLMLKLTTREAQRSTARAHTHVLVMALRIVLHIAGFACLTYAAYMANVIAGVAVAGLSCFVLARLFTVSSATEQDNSQTMRQ
jgi:hypothetical protein